MENRLVLSLVLDTDSYKLSHWCQYPPKTTAMFSYFESRGGRWRETLFFGLQYYLKKYLSNPITRFEVEEAKAFAQLHGCPFNYDGWMKIVNTYGGRLPIKIRAVPEGCVIPTHNILFSVQTSVEDPDIFWIVSWIETLLVRLWYPITIATYGWHVKSVIQKYLNKTSDNPNAEIGFKLHDFGSRGVSCQEQAMIGGAAHLVNFMGSDTIAGIWMANKYYNINMAGFSIPAAEHSTMSMWGKDNEVDAYRNMINQYGGTPIFACVSDTWNIYNAAANLWGDKLKEEVMKMNATLVVRPDSGDPVEVVSRLLCILDGKFGSVINHQGYRVLNKVRVIQGDGINDEILEKILEAAEKLHFSTTNLAFGMGGGLLQKGFDRDTNKFAFKCSWAKVDGKDIEVYKDPATDPGKKSKKGILDLELSMLRKVKTVNGESYNSLMQTVYLNGDILKEYSFEEIRQNANGVIYYE